MSIIIEFLKFILFSLLIVAISKYILVKLLRKLAETLNLKPKTVGNIAGIATSIPELLTASFSAMTGLISTSIFNIMSSNIINLIQYIISVILSKNRKLLQNKALKIDLLLIVITIIIPIVMMTFNIETNVAIAPIFILLFIFFYYINHNTHNLYLNKETNIIVGEIEKEQKWLKGKKRKTILYAFLLFLTAILLYFVGNILSDVLNGILLGFLTSIPELITFFEAQKHHKDENSHLGLIEATNNLFSSNVLNLFIIQSITIIIFNIYN